MDYRQEIYPSQSYEVLVNMRAIEYIKENWTELNVGSLYDPNRATGKKVVDIKSEPTLLINFLAGFKRTPEGFGRRVDSYQQAKTNPRRMTTVGISLQGISRIIRHTICRDNMIDLDIKNCHPVILKNWCDAKGVVSDRLADFNQNRTERFQQVQAVMDWTKDDAKTYVLRLTNGGGIQGKENEAIMEKLQELEWFSPLLKELTLIRERVKTTYPDLVKKAIKAKGKDYYNLDGVVLSYLLTNMENQILQAMVNACVKKRVRISSLIYDGFMVYKDGVDSLIDFCSYLEQEVKENTNHVVSIVPKEMDEGLEIPDTYMDSEQRMSFDKEKKKEEMQLEKIRKEQQKQLDKEFKLQQKQLKKEAKEQKESDEETDRVLADEFLEAFKGKIKYDKNRHEGYFYKETTRLWVSFNNFESLYESILNELQIEKAKDLKNVGFIVKTKLMNRRDDLSMFDMVTGIVSLQNGKVYDMKQGIERDRVKEDYCSIYLKHRYTEDYDKKWVKKYVSELVGAEVADQLLELVGYSLSAENVLKLVIILIGKGDNGKSLFIEMVQKCMGDYQTMANAKIIKKPRFENNTHEAHLFALLNKRAVFSTELSETDEFNNVALKQISGNDGISIRNSGSPETLSVTLKCVPWIATNVMSKINDPVFGNRLACIEFPATFERSAAKAEEIKSHEHDLFCAFLDGGYRFYQRNRVINLLPQIKGFTEQQKQKQDSFIQFFEENEFKVQDTSKEMCKDLYYSYAEFAKKSVLPVDGKETFYKKVEDKFKIEKTRINEGNFYKLKRV
jgi:P4 family phage/plasmid primase-like protien